MIYKYVDRIMKEVEEEGVRIESKSGDKVVSVSRLLHVTRDNLLPYEPNLVAMIQNNNPNFSSARFKANAYTCFRKIIFAFVKDDSNIYKPFVTKSLLESLNKVLDESKKEGYTRIIERVIANPMFLSNYVANENEERLGFCVTVGRKDYYKDNNVYRDVDFDKKENIVSSYYLEFVKKKGVKHVNEVVLTNCPNCGAPSKFNAKGECEYCHTYIENEKYCWSLDKICYWDKREGINNGC